MGQNVDKKSMFFTLTEAVDIRGTISGLCCPSRSAGGHCCAVLSESALDGSGSADVILCRSESQRAAAMHCQRVHRASAQLSCEVCLVSRLKERVEEKKETETGIA